MGTLLSAAKHHGEAGDPTLFEWIKRRLDDLVALEPITFVALLGLVVIAIPAAILLVYAYQRRKVTQK